MFFSRANWRFKLTRAARSGSSGGVADGERSGGSISGPAWGSLNRHDVLNTIRIRRRQMKSYGLLDGEAWRDFA